MKANFSNPVESGGTLGSVANARFPAHSGLANIAQTRMNRGFGIKQFEHRVFDCCCVQQIHETERYFLISVAGTRRSNPERSPSSASSRSHPEEAPERPGQCDDVQIRLTESSARIAPADGIPFASVAEPGEQDLSERFCRLDEVKWGSVVGDPWTAELR